MKIAFLHYHLKTGGVTTVLKAQVEAIQGMGEALVLTGDRAEAGWPCRVVEIPGLGYDQPDSAPPTARKAAEAVIRAISDMWPGGCDVLHIHNPTLAKNRNFLQIVKRLQQAGVNLFLQIHDFAEDGRPGVYFREPYPADCHYGVINSRDGEALLRAGLDPSGLHRLPNAVYPFPSRTDAETPAFVLYPVRAIRRKNIGEALLMSLFLPDGQGLAVTQPPNSPQDVAAYGAWRAFVAEHRLPVEFDAGRRYHFASLVGQATAVITTSIAEGFGLSFLEPWTAGKPLYGRRLGDICRDFEANGVRLDTLYDRLDVPVEWIDMADFFRKWQAAVFKAAKIYGYRVEEDVIKQGFASMKRNGRIDFGMLDEPSQRRVLGRLIARPAAVKKLAGLNPGLLLPFGGPDSSETIAGNRRAVDLHYCGERYRHRLVSIYEKVISRPVRHRIDKRRLVAAFFDLERFTLLKWGSHDG